MILEGKPLASKIYQEIETKKEGYKKPFLAIILVGEDPASLVYVGLKEKITSKLGFGFKLYHFSAITPQQTIENLISNLNEDENVSSILIQLPLPEKYDSDHIISLIKKEKDVDGFSKLFPAPTAQAIMELLYYYNYDLNKKKIVLVGHGKLVGKPLAELMQEKGIIPTICDSKNKELINATKDADVIISATGVPGLIRPDMIKEGVVLIDAGTAEVSGKIMGDIDPKAFEKASAYTPNPGGVGPVTVAILMRNILESAKR